MTEQRVRVTCVYDYIVRVHVLHERYLAQTRHIPQDFKDAIIKTSSKGRNIVATSLMLSRFFFPTRGVSIRLKRQVHIDFFLQVNLRFSSSSCLKPPRCLHPVETLVITNIKETLQIQILSRVDTKKGRGGCI